MTSTQLLLLLLVFRLATPSPPDNELQVKRYLEKYGYPTQDLEPAVRMFQRMSGLEVTGEVDEDTFQQTLVLRCGGRDVELEEGHHPPSLATPVLYSISRYPPPDYSLMSDQEIDRVVSAAAQLWSVGEVRLERSEAERPTVNIVFCDFSVCLEDSSEEELARPVYNVTTGSTVIYLDSRQSWADKDSLSALTYGAAFNLQVQLLQVMVHQFGHVVGLAHTNRVTSAMMPFYLDWIAEQHLQLDKIDKDLVLKSQAECRPRSLYLLVLIFLLVTRII